MRFTELQKSAILRVAFQMAAADEKTDHNELIMLLSVASKIGVAAQNATAMCESISDVDALSTITEMNNSDKKFVTALLCGLMVVDGELHPQEQALWNLTRIICNLPTISIEECMSELESIME